VFFFASQSQIASSPELFAREQSLQPNRITESEARLWSALNARGVLIALPANHPSGNTARREMTSVSPPAISRSPVPSSQTTSRRASSLPGT
jgi:hypothetical protein